MSVPPSTVKRASGGSAKTPRTSRKAAPESGGAADKAALLKAAASTPLPTSAKAGAEAEGEAEGEQPRAGRSTVRRRLSAAKSPAAGKSPAARARSASAGPRARPTVAGLATPVFWLVLLTAAAAGLAALAVPYCQQADCAALVRGLPAQVGELAAQARTRAAAVTPTDLAAGLYSAARERALAAADAAQAQWHSLVRVCGCCGMRCVGVHAASAGTHLCCFRDVRVLRLHLSMPLSCRHELLAPGSLLADRAGGQAGQRRARLPL